MSSCDSMWVDSNRSEEPANLDDFISGLPDSLLLDIISRLPARNAVSTTILSKRWLGLWRFTHVLNICYNDVVAVEYYVGFTGMRRFVASVSNALRLHQSPKIEKFDVSLIYLNSFSDDINAWLLIALTKNVQKLKLYLHRIPGEFDEEADEHDSDSDDDDDDDWRIEQNLFGLHVLPAFLSNCSSLVSLKISNCRFERRERINWKSLKVLLLRLMSPDNNLLADIFSGCPSLESLKLCCCDNFDYIESESLQQLVINYHKGTSEGSVDTLTISAPKLRSLQISESLTASGVSLINSSVSLVNANIDFSLMYKLPDMEASREMHKKCLREILENLRHVKYLTIGSWCLQVFSRMEDVIAPFSNLACLTLKTSFSPYVLPGIKRLLVLTPLMDTLIIEIDIYGFWPPRIGGFNESEAENGREYWVSQEGFMQEALRSLRRVNIVGSQSILSKFQSLMGIPGHWNNFEDMVAIMGKIFKGKKYYETVGKLAFNAFVYHIWMERNGRAHGRKQRHEEELFKVISTEVHSSRGSNDEMEFIAFILNNAEHLEKMIIQRRKAAGYATTNGCVDARWIAERVSSFPRCSSTTVSVL